MRNFFFTVLILIIINSCSSADSEYTKTIQLFQYELNTQYADASTSPLTQEDLATFKSLEFFDIDKNFSIEADFELTPYAPVFEMQTTTDRLPLYKKYGIAYFNLNGIKCELSLYQNQEYLTSLEYGNLLFLPFNDKTNGNTSYSGGRFIDIEIPKEGSKTIIIDFNKSYNPYCAYNHKYSCPIPPSENNLNVEIKAGVKAYKEHH